MNIAFDEARHAYELDGQPVPSVTQVLDHRNDWSHVEAWRLEAARALGQDVHSAVNLMVRGVLDWDTVDPAVLPYVRGAALFLHQSGATVMGSELRVASKALGVAGTLDLLLHWDGWEYFADWKISAAVPTTVGLQLAAYERLYAETFRRGRKAFRSRRICIRLHPGGYKVDRQTDTSDISQFVESLILFKQREIHAYGGPC